MKLFFEARAGIEPAIEVLQTPALPLGYRARFISLMWNMIFGTRLIFE